MMSRDNSDLCRHKSFSYILTPVLHNYGTSCFRVHKTRLYSDFLILHYKLECTSARGLQC